MKIIAGPCQHETLEQSLEIATECKRVCDTNSMDYYFKASFDKANRTSISGQRGQGLQKTMQDFRELKQKISTSIAGGEAEFTKYGWNKLISNKCIDIAQPEVCGLGGITEYLKVAALAQSNFIPVINHVWGSAVSIAVNLHLLTAQPDMPGGLFPSKSMLEFDTTEKNIFITDLPKEEFSILDQVKNNKLIR